MSLRARLEALIAAEGPMTAADYMTACLHDPEFGYYAVRPRLGAEGDFITAPLVSQMFGELIGLWAVEVWTRLGRPAPFRLVEVGPGDGTLMSDLLRAARLAPDFLATAELWLVEPSAPLRALQAERLGSAELERPRSLRESGGPSGQAGGSDRPLARPRWTGALEAVPDGAPLILIANEVLDCLPARQFMRLEGGWAERRVGLRDGALAFGLAPPPADFRPPPELAEVARGALIELSPAQAAFARALGERVARDGGCALLIDYGRDRPEPGDTLQALVRHRKVDPLACPGEADLTVHADFPAVAAAARAAGAEVTPIVGQGAFLRALGIELRAEALARARPHQAGTLARQLARLTGAGEMGSLFKAVALHAPGLAVPGFKETA